MLLYLDTLTWFRVNQFLRNPFFMQIMGIFAVALIQTKTGFDT